jgi:hypothetical protein
MAQLARHFLRQGVGPGLLRGSGDEGQQGKGQLGGGEQTAGEKVEGVDGKICTHLTSYQFAIQLIIINDIWGW